jgi:hypothetical protein
MGDEEKSSFHGSLARFAYVPTSGLSSSSPPRHDHDHARERAAWPLPAQAASAPYSIKGRVTIPTPGRVVRHLLSRERKGDSRRSLQKTDTRSRKRQKLGNATSHLSGIPDCVAEDLDGLSSFCQSCLIFFLKRPCSAILRNQVSFSLYVDAVLNADYVSPGHMSAVTGHHYANPTNHFWHCLHLSGTCLIPTSPCTNS